ncbi:MAG: uracil-DNA glycosylase family protein [Aestuariibacter sp.]
MIIGQAPGLKAHDSRRPWNDPSGDRLRDWLQLDNKTFYDPKHVALVPMGFCYPGKGKSGDLPPDRRCAPTWHPRIFEELIAVKLKILVGSYAQNYYLSDKLTLTQRCKEWQTYLPDCVVLPHPSPRNNIWLKRNDWFEKDVIPAIRNRVNDILQD